MDLTESQVNLPQRIFPIFTDHITGNAKVHTIEYVLSALAGCGIDNAKLSSMPVNLRSWTAFRPCEFDYGGRTC